LGEASRIVTIANEQGLHARPVMRFVDLAKQFQSQIFVVKKNARIDGKNPMEMMLLEATKGTQLELQAIGEDADGAVVALASLVENGFGEM